MLEEECFCHNPADIAYFGHQWTLVPPATLLKMESMLGHPDGKEYFYRTCKSAEEHIRPCFLCPLCDALTFDGPDKDQPTSRFYAAITRYSSQFIAKSAKRTVYCRCTGKIPLDETAEQWAMLPKAALHRDYLAQAFDDHDDVEGFYRRVFRVGKWLLGCPHCQGMNLFSCDPQGANIVTMYYLKGSYRWPNLKPMPRDEDD